MKNTTVMLIIFGLFFMLISTCGGRDKSPIEVNTDTGGYDPGQNAAGYFTMLTLPSGGPFNMAEGMAVVDHDAPEARISCDFATLIDTASLNSAFNLESTDGNSVALDFDWNLGTYSSVDIRPGIDLSHNTTYIFTINPEQLSNVAGDKLDVDGDETGGEIPDDNIRLRFTTVQEGDTLPGQPVPETYDDIPPRVISDLYYLLDADSIVTIHWMDVSLAVDIVDYYYDPDGSQLQKALAETMFHSNSVILREGATKTSVPGNVFYDDDSTSTTYLRLTFDPSQNLAAGELYEFVLKAQLILDDNGNKLNNTDDRISAFVTTNMTSDSSIIVEDVISPAVSHFSDNGPTFTVTFTEEIDVSTINAATITVETYSGDPNSGNFVVGRVANGGAPTGFATTVTFHPNNPDWNSGYVTIRSSIRDLAGNRKGFDSSYYWQ